MYRFIANFYPKNLKEGYNKLVLYSNLKIHPERFIGFVLLFGLAFSLTASFNLLVFFGINFFLSFLLLFIFSELLVYTILLLYAEAKGRFVERMLPDALQLMSSNLRAGLTTDRALLLAARPEFGPLQDEINKVGKEIAMGKEIDKALLEMTVRVKSDKFEKTIRLIVSGVRAGGELASLLEQTAENLNEQQFIEKRVKANVAMYVIFIFAAIAFGAPLLFGLSSFLVEVMTNTISQIEIPETTSSINLPIAITKVSVDPHFVFQYTIVSLITISILGALVLGLINKGREREGVKYIPLLIACTLIMFFVIRYLMKNLLSGLFGL